MANPGDAELTAGTVDTVAGDEDAKETGPSAEEIDLAEASGGEDPLLDCLVYLTAHYGNAKSPDVLKAGLPLAGTRMPASMFAHAAERVGLKARVVKRQLARINRLVLPVVLILKDGRACLLADLPRKRVAKVILPETGGGELEVELRDLAEDYTGYVIYVRPVAHVDADVERVCFRLGIGGAGAAEPGGPPGQSWSITEMGPVFVATAVSLVHGTTYRRRPQASEGSRRGVGKDAEGRRSDGQSRVSRALARWAYSAGVL